MKKWIVCTLALLLSATYLSYTAPAMAQDPEYAWVLVDVVDHDSAEKWAQANEHEAYNTDFSCSGGTFSAKTTFIGKGEDWRNPPKIHGEAVRVTATFSKPPERIAPDEEVTLSVTVSASEYTLSFFTFGGSASANFDSPDLAPGSMSRTAVRFTTIDGETQYEVGAKNNYQTIEGIFIAKAPRGREEGEQIAVRQQFYMGVSMGTYYIYEWRGTGSVPSEDPPGPEVSVQPTERPETTPGKIPDFYDRPSIGPEYIPEDFPMLGPPSGVDISDIGGEVYIHVWDEDGYDYYFADLEKDLPINSIIQTGPDGFALLSLADMTTFVVPPNSIVAVGGQSKAEGRLSLLAGHVWTNFKSMVKDGSMDIEMSQAVAGIKGTTFILEDDGETSTVKVFEGEVTFTPRDGGEPTLVTPGMQLSATQAGLGTAQTFDMDAELENWDENVQEMTRQAMAEEERHVNADETEESKDGTGITVTTVLIAVLLLVVVVLVVVIIVNQNRKKKESAMNQPHGYGPAGQNAPSQFGTAYPAPPHAQGQSFCQNCGRAVSANSKFCPGCGKPVG